MKEKGKMKKVIVSLSLVALLVAACFINAGYNKNSEKAKILGEAAYVNNNVTTQENDCFYDLRQERDLARADACELLREITENPASTPEGRSNAEAALVKIAVSMESEAACEAVLKSRGFSDVMLTVTDDAVTVSLRERELLPAQLAQIKDAVLSCTGVGADRIKVVTANE